MELFTEELMELTLGESIDATKNRLMEEDDTLQKDETDLSELEVKVMDLKISQEDKNLVADYIACLQTVDARIADLAYEAGILDAVKLLKKLDLIKAH